MSFPTPTLLLNPISFKPCPRCVRECPVGKNKTQGFCMPASSQCGQISAIPDSPSAMESPQPFRACSLALCRSHPITFCTVPAVYGVPFSFLTQAPYSTGLSSSPRLFLADPSKVALSWSRSAMSIHESHMHPHSFPFLLHLLSARQASVDWLIRSES